MYSGVVVIDDQPEVSIDDPSFLFESNEGFQEVTSRRTQKSKQKAALEEALKKSQEQQAQAAAQAKRIDKEAKVDVSLYCLCPTSFSVTQGHPRCHESRSACCCNREPTGVRNWQRCVQTHDPRETA